MNNNAVILFGVQAHLLTDNEYDEHALYYKKSPVYGVIGKCFSVFAQHCPDDTWYVWIEQDVHNSLFDIVLTRGANCSTLEEAQQDLLARVEQKMKMYQTAHNVLQNHKFNNIMKAMLST